MKDYKKAINFTKKAALIAGVVLMLIDCGGGSSGTKESGSAIAGTFVDAPVDGLSYTADPSKITGMTKNGGKFDCETGDTVTFSIGDLVLGQVACQETVTPLNLVGTTDINDPVVTNIARLLQTLDSNSDPFTITINSAAADEVAGLSINITNQSFDFDNDPNLQSIFNSLGVTPVSADFARNRLKQTLTSQQNPPPADFVGTYDFSNGKTAYLHLYSNGQYIYETSTWPGDCGSDCEQSSIIRVFGTYVINNNTLSLSPIVAQDSLGNNIQSDAIDSCWMFSTYYQTVSIPNISYKNGIYFTADSISSDLPDRPQHCNGGKPDITPAGTSAPKISDDPNGYLIN